MSTKHFQPKERPDLRSRKSIINYLENHPAHADMYDPPTLAHNIKLRNLPIPYELETAAYNFVAAQYGDDPDVSAMYVIDEWNYRLNERLEEFGDAFDCTVSFEGRSGGWIVAHQNTGTGRTRPISLPTSDLDNTSFAYLRHMAKVSLAFDDLCDELFADFMSYVQAYEIECKAEAEVKQSEELAAAEPPFPII